MSSSTLRLSLKARREDALGGVTSVEVWLLWIHLSPLGSGCGIQVRWQGTGAKLHYRKGVLIMCLYYRHGQLRGIHTIVLPDNLRRMLLLM